ncbi:MAG: aspartate aminotransferase family protein, partial [Deltaproteobacteria bacterium]|nr:aspartate aminotransferase family protein [Deltaproteobacteria bacterium]
MEKEEFRRYGHEIVDWIVDYLDTVEDYPVLAQVEPGEVKGRLPESAPEDPEPMERIWKDFKNDILPGMTHWQHPSFFAYFPANSSEPSLLAEFLTAALGAQCMVWQTSPAATELEEVVMAWLRQMLGLPEAWTGVIQDTASTSTLCALLCARERATDFMANDKGLFQGDAQGLTVYTSEESHSSIE